MELDNKFSNTWKLWYHHKKDNWKIDGYRNIYSIENIKDFWQLYNNWDKLGGIIYKHFFLMKNNITPVWEDESNRNGGCWSFKISEDNAWDLWLDLSLYLVTENLGKNPDDILGISICLKKNNNCVVKIWNRNNQNSNINNLNSEILKKWGTDIIYIAHLAN